CSAPTALRPRPRSRGPSRSPRKGRRRRRAGAADTTRGPRRSRDARGGRKRKRTWQAPLAFERDLAPQLAEALVGCRAEERVLGVRRGGPHGLPVLVAERG